MSIGVVVIGRNEGERLVACLKSVINNCQFVVYVDSGSTDDSLEKAQALGANCIELDMSTPFTAARARNNGFAALKKLNANLGFVFFIDGDCQVFPEWIDAAINALKSNSKIAAVCGRRRESHPLDTLYNTFCDIEWNTPIGSANACGGDAIYRVNILEEVGGFDPTFIAGEEPELCFRIRKLGYLIQRIDVDMTLHDANMTHLYQWWKRNERSGHAYLLGWVKHGKASSEKFYSQDIRRIVVWSIAFYISVVVSIVLMSIIPGLLFFSLICLQSFRICTYLKSVQAEYGMWVTLKYSFSLMAGKIPQFTGVVKAYLNKKFKKQLTLVEYK